MQAVPELLDTAELRAGRECDNLSVIAMNWADSYSGAAHQVSTLSLGPSTFTTKMEEFGKAGTSSPICRTRRSSRRSPRSATPSGGMPKNDASQQAIRRPAAPGAHPAKVHPPCRGLGAGRVRRHPGALHRERRGEGARFPAGTAARAGSRPNTACCRAATNTRTDREAARGKQSGRTQEIQRLIGRSLRAVIDLKKLGERTIQIDCDVIQADGGTRTAGITGAFVALHDAVTLLMQRGLIAESPVRDFVAAVSVGIYEGAPVLDLDYAEDSTCDTDMNVVMTGSGGFVEVQGTAEGAPFSQAQMDALMVLAQGGIRGLIAKQKEALGIS